MFALNLCVDSQHTNQQRHVLESSSEGVANLAFSMCVHNGCSRLRFCSRNVGTDTQRILVAQMHRRAETPAMAAFDPKGRCLYANTLLASMLGHKVKDLRSKDISQLLPQPYGALHMKWFRVSRGAAEVS